MHPEGLLASEWRLREGKWRSKDLKLRVFFTTFSSPNVPPPAPFPFSPYVPKNVTPEWPVAGVINIGDAGKLPPFSYSEVKFVLSTVDVGESV